MHYSQSNSVTRKVGKGFALTAIFTLGLLSIVATGGGGGGNGPDPEPGTLQFSAATYSGDEDAGDITVTVTRTGGSDGAATVDVSDASSGTATSGTDYTAITTTPLSWADGNSDAKTIVVSVIDDGAVELDETVGLALGNATGATLGTVTSTTVTILNDDIAAAPGNLKFSVSNYSAAEGDGNATITVNRTGGDSGVVGVSYAASNGTAIDGSDFTAVSSTLSWNDGDSNPQTFLVPIIDDTDVEVPEKVNLTLSIPTGGATLGSPNTANLTITSEDRFGTIRFSASSYNVDETDGTVTNVITLERVDGSSGAISVDVSDAGSGSATGSGTDYTYDPNPMTVSWSDGETADKNVTITLINDGDSESTETVSLSLGNATGGASIGSPSTATVNIADDDAAATPGELMFDAASYSFAEDGGSVTITVNRVNGTLGAVGVSYATSDNTATAGVDYTATSGILSWGNGVGGAQTFTVAITSDTVVENDETVTLSISNPTGGVTLGTPNVATLIISNDDTNLTMNIGDGTYWVAFQDGPSGTWTEWSPTSSNTYDFPVIDGSGRYGVAFRQQESDTINTVEKTYVIHATLGELAKLNAFNNPKYSVSGTLSGYTPGNDSAVVVMHNLGVGGELLNLPALYTIPYVSAGSRDLLAFEFIAPLVIPNNFVIRRNIDVLSNLADQDVDFTGDSDIEAVTATLNDFFGGSGSTGQELEVYFATNNGTSFNIMSETYDGSTAVTYPYITNTSMTQTGDSYSFQISNSTGSKYRVRNVAAIDGNPGTRNMGLGNPVSLTGTNVSTTQTTGLSYTPNPTSLNGSPVFRGFQIDLDQTVTGISGGAHWQFKISDGWLGASTSYTYPALSSISGFNAGWDMSSGILTNATVSTATTQSGRGSLSLVTRKTMGRNSNNMNPDTWVVAKKLAHNNRLRMDSARQFSNFTW